MVRDWLIYKEMGFGNKRFGILFGIKNYEKEGK